MRGGRTRGFPEPAHLWWLLEGSGPDSHPEGPRFPTLLPAAPSRRPRASPRQPQIPDPRDFNSPRAAPRGVRHFPAFSSKAGSSSSLAPSPPEGWPRATGESSCRRSGRAQRAPRGPPPHLVPLTREGGRGQGPRPRPPEAGGAGEQPVGAGFVAPRPAARWRHAPPTPPGPGSGSAQGSGGRGGAERSGRRIVGRAGGRAGRGPDPARDRRRAAAEAQVSACARGWGSLSKLAAAGCSAGTELRSSGGVWRQGWRGGGNELGGRGGSAGDGVRRRRMKRKRELMGCLSGSLWASWGGRSCGFEQPLRRGRGLSGS